jgi:SAM-dependent methyltransferase
MVTSPLTQSSSVTLLRTIPASLLIEQWKKVHGLDIAGELEGIPELFLYRCDTTGLLFFSPSQAAGSADLYEKLSRQPWYYLPDKWEYRLALGELRGHRRVVDIGCGRGEFVRRMRDEDIDACGLEMTPAAAAEARQAGIPVEVAELSEFAARNEGSFDAVCAFQVLEHVTEPHAFIAGAVRLLKPGGLFIVSVPNAESYLRHSDNLLDLPPHHMLRWSIGAFRALQSLFPLRIDHACCEPLAEYHIGDFLYAQKQRIAAGGGFTASLLLRRRAQPLWDVFEKCLRIGLCRFFCGHSLYVVLKKQAGAAA